MSKKVNNQIVTAKVKSNVDNTTHHLSWRSNKRISKKAVKERIEESSKNHNGDSWKKVFKVTLVGVITFCSLGAFWLVIDLLIH